MRRCARTRFEPDDWGLNPPIDILPQIAQERAMRSSKEWSVGRGAREGRQRDGTIPPTLPDPPTPGRALVTRRAVVDIVRSVTLGSYGVSGFGGSLFERASAALEGRPAGLRVSLRDGSIAIHLRLRVAKGLPIAEVARQVDSAIRYAVRRALDREVDRLTIRIAGLEGHPGGEPPVPPPPHGIGPSELADSGTDVF